MVIYFIYFLYGLFLSMNYKKYSNKFWILFIIVGAIFLCGGYMTGSDWRNYELYYSWFDANKSLSLFSLEPGYVLYSFLFYCLKISYWPFTILTKLLLYAILVNTINKLSIGNKRFEITYFMIIFGLYLFIDGPIRNFIAIVISIGTYKYWVERKILKYSLFVVCAMLFHLSAIMLLFFYPLYPLKLSNKRLFLLFIIFNLLFCYFYSDIIIITMSLLSFIHPLIEIKMRLYFLEGNEFEQNSFLSLGMLFHILIFILLLYKRESIEKQKMGKLIFCGSIYYLFLYRMASVVDILYRLQLYFSILYTLGIGCLFVNMKIKNNKKIFLAIMSIYLMYMLHGIITSNYKYIPYTNYFEYVFTEKELPYEYRSNYNLINSPYNKNEE